MAELSVVLIGRNEASNIAGLLASVLREPGVRPDEVVVVDSASSDGMAEIAARHPVEVLRLADDQPLSAAAGRHVGLRWTTGDVVLFLDGDMELHPGWLDEGLRVLAEHPDAAAVTGPLVERAPGAAPAAPPAPAAFGRGVREVPFAAGAALYRREVLDRIGDFNPFLRAEEEPELGLRIRHAGHRILATETPIALHHSPPPHSAALLVRRWRRGLFQGAGQNVRLLAGTPLLRPYLRERGYALAPGLVALAGLGAAVGALVTRRARWPARWSLLVGVGLLADVARRRGDVRATAAMVLHRALITEGMVRGLFLPLRPPASYPGRFTVVRSSRGGHG